jgi:hypothetical protein
MVDDWAVGGWTLTVGACDCASACVCASVCASACACGIGAVWREGEGYGECLEPAAAPPRVRGREREVREREAAASSYASCPLTEILGVRLDRRRPKEEIKIRV